MSSETRNHTLHPFQCHHKGENSFLSIAGALFCQVLETTLQPATALFCQVAHRIGDNNTPRHHRSPERVHACERNGSGHMAYACGSMWRDEGHKERNHQRTPLRIPVVSVGPSTAMNGIRGAIMSLHARLEDFIHPQTSIETCCPAPCRVWESP
jgi:hypothetical protein